MSKIILTFLSSVLFLSLILIDFTHAGCAESYGLGKNPIYYESACMLKIETGEKVFFEDRELAEYYNCENFMIGLSQSEYNECQQVL